jgi:hypothetical protein
MEEKKVTRTKFKGTIKAMSQIIDDKQTVTLEIELPEQWQLGQGYENVIGEEVYLYTDADAFYA